MAAVTMPAITTGRSAVCTRCGTFTRAAPAVMGVASRKLNRAASSRR